MTSDATAARIAALNAAVETRLSGSPASDIIARATEFVAFLLPDNPPATAAARKDGAAKSK